MVKSLDLTLHCILLLPPALIDSQSCTFLSSEEALSFMTFLEVQIRQSASE